MPIHAAMGPPAPCLACPHLPPPSVAGQATKLQRPSLKPTLDVDDSRLALARRHLLTDQERPAILGNRSVRADHVEQVVWEPVCALLEVPDKLAAEYRRCLHEASNSTVRSDELAQLGQ